MVVQHIVELGAGERRGEGHSPEETGGAQKEGEEGRPQLFWPKQGGAFRSVSAHSQAQAMSSTSGGSWGSNHWGGHGGGGGGDGGGDGGGGWSSGGWSSGGDGGGDGGSGCAWGSGGGWSSGGDGGGGGGGWGGDGGGGGWGGDGGGQASRKAKGSGWGKRKRSVEHSTPLDMGRPRNHQEDFRLAAGIASSQFPRLRFWPHPQQLVLQIADGEHRGLLQRWWNASPDLQDRFREALRTGQPVFEWTDRGEETKYSINLQEMTQTNLDSQLSRTLQVILVIMF